MRTAWRPGQRAFTTLAIQPAPSAETSVDLLPAPVLAQGVEEPSQGLHVPPPGRPHQVPAVMIDDDDQVLVALAVGDLVDPDACQAGEGVLELLGVGHSALGDGDPDGAPYAARITSVTADFEQCVANHATMSSNMRVWPAPCRAHGTWAATTPCSGAAHPGRVGLQPCRHRPRGPGSATAAGSLAVIARATLPATTATQLFDAPSGGRTQATIAPASSSKKTDSTTVCSTPSGRCHSAAFCTPFLSLVLDRQTAQKPRKRTACNRRCPLSHPRKESQEPLMLIPRPSVARKH